jgi:peptidoglycan/LPS O-acetylase OafA/YrhL
LSERIEAVRATNDEATLAPTADPSPQRGRLVGLDGIRGLAALFVMLHHCWLLTFPGFPVNSGPMWTGWLLYGHFAVVVFITLSGFSLAVSPARHDWQLGGLTRFAHRRAWRILPPYWAALIFSLLIAWLVIPQPSEPVPDAKSVAVFGLLLQDVFHASSPNGAFWSIAVEAHLYLVFPIMLLVLRRAGAIVMLTAVTVVVVTIGALAPSVSLADMLMRLIPQFATLFALGVVAAGIATGRIFGTGRLRRLPWHWLSALAVAPVLTLIVVQGSAWTVRNYFWIDLAIGPAVALLLTGVATGRPRAVVRLLDTRPMRSLGSFSYSLYLTHAPIVWVIRQEIVGPRVAPGVPTFLATLALAAPVTILFARAFAAVFELPFQRNRSWSALATAARQATGGRLPWLFPVRARHRFVADGTLSRPLSPSSVGATSTVGVAHHEENPVVNIDDEAPRLAGPAR